MFAILDHELIPPLRWRDRIRKSAPYRTERFERPGCVRMTVQFPLDAGDAQREERAREAVGALARCGASAVLLSPGFPFRELPARHGIAVANPAPMYKRMAGRLCEWAADEMRIAPGRLHVALMGNRAGMEMLACAEYLRDRAPRLSVSAGRDTDAVCLGLRKHYGISAGQQPAPDADIILLFDRQAHPIQTRPGSLTIDLTGGIPAVAGGIWANGAAIEPPARFGHLRFAEDTAGLLALLVMSGSVQTGELVPQYLTAAGKAVGLRELRRGGGAAENA